MSVGGSYVGDLLPGFLLISIGMGFSFVPISIAALAGVQPAEAGLASGLINTSQQIGGALGIAVLSAVASSSTNDALASGSSLPVALTDGFHAAFYGAAAVALVGVLVALFVVRREDLVEESVDAVPAARSGLAPTCGAAAEPRRPRSVLVRRAEVRRRRRAPAALRSRLQ